MLPLKKPNGNTLKALKLDQIVNMYANKIHVLNLKSSSLCYKRTFVK